MNALPVTLPAEPRPAEPSTPTLFDAPDEPSGPAQHLDPVECTRLEASARWASKVETGPGGCLLWTAATTQNGYPQISLGGRTRLAHRVALVAKLGRDLLPGMQAGHVCHDLAVAAGECVATDAEPCAHRRCVNPDHLVEQTARANILSGGTVNAANAAKVLCPRGHPLEGSNLTAANLKAGERDCRTCNNDATEARNDVVRDAAQLVGLPRDVYAARHGEAAGTARGIIAENLAAMVPLFDTPDGGAS